MLWRDRRAPLAALLVLSAWLALLLTLIDAGASAIGWWVPRPLPDGLTLLVTINLLLLLWRAGWRCYFTGRFYGRGQAILAIPRMVASNTIAVMAAWRAVHLYWHMLRSGRTRWDKTIHTAVELVPDVAPSPTRRGWLMTADRS